MALTTTGKEFIAQSVINDSPTFFDNANAYLGVGDNSTPFSVAQTDLLGSSQLRKGQEAGFPTRSTNVLTFNSIFGTGDANFAWEEWGMFNAGAGGTMINRKVESLGTKTSAHTWDVTITLTFN